MADTPTTPLNTVASQMVSHLVEAGVKNLYAITGDSLNPVNDAVRLDGRIQWIHMRHEESGAFAAGAEAQLAGRLACCAGSSGPGHVHLVNGLYDCRRSYAPVVALASTCATSQWGTQYFQETNTTRLFDDCSDYNVVATTAEQTPRMLHSAMQTAVERHTVAVMALPGDIAAQPLANITESEILNAAPAHGSPSEADVAQVTAMLAGASKIAMYCGSGVKNAHEEMVEVSQRLHAPVVSTLKGMTDVLYDCPNGVGVGGGVGLTAGHTTIQEADLILWLGCDFPYTHWLPTGKTVIQVDVRGDHIGRRIAVTKGICADCGMFLRALLHQLPQKTDDTFLRSRLAAYQADVKAAEAIAASPGDTDQQISPEYVTATISRLAADNAVFTVDTGMNVIWTARYLQTLSGRDVIGSFNHGSMANAMPQAIGAALACPDRQIISLSGDGGISMLLGDLATIAQYRLPVKIFVYNNRSLGFVEMEMRHAGIPDWQTDMYNPDFAAFAATMGFHTAKVTRPVDVEGAIAAALAADGPALVDIYTKHPE